LAVLPIGQLMVYSANTTVWITGASSGIGAALAEHYARLGASVILSSRNESQLQTVALRCVKISAPSDGKKRKSPDFFVVPVDMASTESIAKAWAEVGKLNRPIDILINNAGISQRSLTRDTGTEIDRKVMELNFFGTLTLTKMVLPHMLTHGGGHIAAISSIVGKFGFPLRSAYSASKHALKGFFESLDAEERKHRIFVTLVYPGFITTKISVNALTADGTAHGAMDNNQKQGMAPEICARKIERAIRRRKHEVLVGRKELLLVHIRRFLPALYYTMARRVNPT